MLTQQLQPIRSEYFLLNEQMNPLHSDMYLLLLPSSSPLLSAGGSHHSLLPVRLLAGFLTAAPFTPLFLDRQRISLPLSKCGRACSHLMNSHLLNFDH
jgi:hypothetical protein